MGWCDDPRSKQYNKLIKLPFGYRFEKLYRRDYIYDIILVLIIICFLQKKIKEVQYLFMYLIKITNLLKGVLQ